MRFAAHTDIGRKYDHNEDHYVLPVPNPKYGTRSIDTEARGHLFVLCDGLGGGESGEVASELAGNWLLKDYYASDTGPNPNSAIGAIIEGIHVKLVSLTREYDQYKGMATTLVALLVLANKAYVNSVGDSRAYLYRDGGIEQVTDDQTEVWNLYKSGAVTKDEMRNMPRGNLLRSALGNDERFEVNQYTVDTCKNDLFLLCSDGLTDMLGDEKIVQILARSVSLEEKASGLIAAANRQGGKDNITVVLVGID